MLSNGIYKPMGYLSLSSALDGVKPGHQNELVE
jgi:hypothetical protein